VIANGDIDSAARARHVLAATGAAGLMVGRAAFGQPWLFAELAAILQGRSAPPPPTLARRFDILRRHLDGIYALYGDMMGTRIARKHWGWYSSRLPVAAEVARTFNRLGSPEEQRDWIDELRTRLLAPARG
jgi:tRNA-dihydrouridine synthase B